MFDICIVLHGVLIVPLWNWNERPDEVGEIVSSFNRTFMELKQPHGCEKKKSSQRFNRTFMELKQPQIAKTATIKSVLIVPLWNWNSAICMSLATVGLF